MQDEPRLVCCWDLGIAFPLVVIVGLMGWRIYRTMKRCRRKTPHLLDSKPLQQEKLKRLAPFLERYFVWFYVVESVGGLCI